VCVCLYVCVHVYNEVCVWVCMYVQNKEMGVQMCDAAARGDVDEVRLLVTNGVHPDEADYDGRTALHLAACEGHVGVISYLIEVKCNISCTDRFGGTALDDAVRHHFDLSNAAQVQALLRQHGASLMDSNTNYTVKMCFAAWSGDLDQIRVLAENKVDLSVGDYDGRTPLHLAACSGHTSIIEYLLKNEGVIVNAVDRFGGTPLDDAIRHGREGAAALLREKGGVCTGDPRLKEIALRMMIHKEARFKLLRAPKIQHIMENSQESNAFRNVGTKLSVAIAEHRSNVEPAVLRLIWSIKGLSARFLAHNGKIPEQDENFTSAAEYVLDLSDQMKDAVVSARIGLSNEVWCVWLRECAFLCRMCTVRACSLSTSSLYF
jgi:ankyrin repeat protein